MSPKALSDSVSEIGSVVSLVDGVAGSAPFLDSRGSIGEDLGAIGKIHPLSRYFSWHCNAFGMGKMKRSINASSTNEMTLAGMEKSDLTGVEKSELESPAISHIKRPRIEVCSFFSSLRS